MAIQIFHLDRKSDDENTGLGTGIIADGIKFHDGAVAMRTRRVRIATAVFSSMDDMMKIHGKNTEVLTHPSEDIERCLDCQSSEREDSMKIAYSRANGALLYHARTQSMIGLSSLALCTFEPLRNGFHGRIRNIWVDSRETLPENANVCGLCSKILLAEGIKVR